MRGIGKIFFIIIFILLLVGCRTKTNGNWNDLNLFNEEIDVDVLSPLNQTEFLDRIFNDYDGSIQRDSITFDLSPVDFNTLGVYQVVVTYQDKNGSDQTVSITVNVLDKIKPVLEGLKDYSLNVGDPMPNFLAGVNATDNYDENLVPTVDFSKVDLTKEGFYSVKYTATDSSQNKVEKTIIVKVIDANTFYQITMSPEIKLAKGNTMVNFKSFVTSVTDKNGQQLLDKGYTLQFDDSAINYHSIGSYPLGITLRNSNQEVVKTISVTVLIDYEVKIEFNDLMVAYNEPNFKTNHLVKRLIDFNGNVVNNYSVTYDQAVDLLKGGDQSIKFSVFNYKSEEVYSKIVTVHVYYPYTLTLKDQSTIYYKALFDPFSYVDTVVDTVGKKVDLNAAGLSVRTKEWIDTTKVGKVNVTFELVGQNNRVYYSERKEIEVIYKYTLLVKNDLVIDFNQPFNIDNYVTVINQAGQVVTNKEELGITVSTLDSVNTKLLGPVSITYQIKENENVIYEVTLNQAVINKQIRLEVKENNVVFYNSTFNILDYITFIDQTTSSALNLEGFTCEAQVDVLSIGEQQILVQLMNQNGLVVYKEVITLFVKFQYEILFNDVSLYQGDAFNALDVIHSYSDATGEIVHLEELGLHLVIIGEVDPTKLGLQTITYKIINEEQKVVFEINKDVDVKSNYVISYNNLYINYGNRNYHLEDLILSINHSLLGEQQLNQDVYLSTLEEVDVMRSELQQVTFILKDQSGVIVYQETHAVEISKKFTIQFTDDLTYYKDDTPYDFDYMDYIVSIVDSRGKEITIGDLYQIQVSSQISPNLIGNYLVEYALSLGFDEILITEHINITVMYPKTPSYQIKPIQENLFMTLEEYTNQAINYYDYIYLFDSEANIVPFPEGYTLKAENPSITTNGQYQIRVTLFHQNQIVDSTSIYILLFDRQYNIDVDPIIQIDSSELLNPFIYVKSLTDLNGNEVDLGEYIEPNVSFKYGSYKLPNGYVFSLLPLSGKFYVYTVVDMENYEYYGFKTVEIQIKNKLQIQLKELTNIQLGDETFDGSSVIKSIKNGFGEELIIGRDVFIECVNLKIHQEGYQSIKIIFKDSNGNRLIEKNVTVHIVSSPYRLKYEQEGNYTIRANHYNTDSFNISWYIGEIVDLNGCLIQLDDGYQLTYEGFIDFTQRGYYLVQVYITDRNLNRYLLTELSFEILNDFDIIFTTQIIDIPVNTPLNLEPYIYKINNFDPNEHVLRYDYNSYFSEGYYNLNFTIYNKWTNEFLYHEPILVRIYEPIR